jgi:RNA polymerase primary sigma factor
MMPNPATDPDSTAASSTSRPAARRPGLSRQEEVELAARVARGDRHARDRMVQANLGLVRAIARDFLGRGMELDDLVGEGHLGLLRATRQFDPRFGTRFSTYAAYWIKQAIRQALMDTTPTIRLPAHMVRTLTRWRRAGRALRRELGRAPGFEEVASSLGLSEEQKRLVARAMNARRARLAGSYEAGAGDRILAGVSDGYRVEEPVEAEDEQDVVRRRMDRLDDRERMILDLRFGLGGEVVTLREVGRRLGITREWARKIQVRAVGKMADE